MKRIISCILSFCLMSAVCTDSYSAVSYLYAPVNNISNFIQSDDLIPVDIGRLSENIYTGGKKTVINIQDIHSDENTQKNIASILGYLADNYNIGTVYFEGAFGDLNFDWIKNIKNESLRKKITEIFINEGKLTGGELFGILNKDGRIKFKGLEEEKIYKENFKILSQMYNDRNIMSEKTENIKNILDSAKKTTYSYRTRLIDMYETDYKNGDISQKNYYKYLLSSAEYYSVSGQDLDNIKEYLDIIEKSESVNYSKLQKTLLQINKKLAGVLPYKEYTELNRLQKKYPKEYFIKLWQYIKKSDINIKDSDLDKMVEYIRMYCDFDIQNLIRSEEKLVSELYKASAQTAAEKNLIFLSVYTDKLGQFFANKINYEDFGFIKNNFRKYIVLLKNYTGNAEIADIKNFYDTVNIFYMNNSKRNLTFTEKILGRNIAAEELGNRVALKNMNRMPFADIIKNSEGQIDVMITGGYHTSELAELMENFGINYAVIMPDISGADIYSAELNFYKDYKKQSISLTNTYQKFIRSSLMNVGWSDPLNVIITNFVDKSLLDGLFADNKNEEYVKLTVSEIEKQLWKIIKEKGLKDTVEISEIEKNENGSYIISVKFNDAERLFYVSENITKEIKDKNEAESFLDDNGGAESEHNNLNVSSENKKSHGKFFKVFSRIITTAMLMPMMMILGGGVSAAGRQKTSQQKTEKSKGITDNGSYIEILNSKGSKYNDVVAEKDSHISLNGNISLSDVIVGTGNSLNVTASDNTVITVSSVDMNSVGELNINIEAEGEFEVTYSGGMIKIYKVLRKDFSSSRKKSLELVSVLKKGTVSLYSEADWDQKDKTDIVIPCDISTYGADCNFVTQKSLDTRSDILYPEKNVRYITFDKLLGYKKDLREDVLLDFIGENGLTDKYISVDITFMSEKYKNEIEPMLSFIAENTAGVNVIRTNLDPETLFHRSKLGMSEAELASKPVASKDRKYSYLRKDGKYIRYPFYDRNWLRSVMEDFFPDFKKQVFMFVWPVESAKHTYVQYKNESTPEQKINADEQFEKFMKSAEEYAKSGKDAFVFIPYYLMRELERYTGDSQISTKFSEVHYGDYESGYSLTHMIQYKQLTAKDVARIDLCKINGVTVVAYLEGNRGHNEQAYLETLVNTYKYGKESLDSMLTRAGYDWKKNIVYVYEGHEVENFDMEKELLSNPSIKKGLVSYVYDNLKRVFVNLYKNMHRFFKGIIPKYMKGNWISVEDAVISEINQEYLDEMLAARSKLGFNAVSVIPVIKGLIDESEYPLDIILSNDGYEIKIYSYVTDNGVLYFIETDSNNRRWQRDVLKYIREGVDDTAENNIISFNGMPGISYAEVASVLDSTYIPVIINSLNLPDSEYEDMGYDTVIEALPVAFNDQLKYPDVAEDMRQVADAINVVKTLKRKSFFGKFDSYKDSYVGVKIASDEHIFNSTVEEDEFLRIVKNSDIDFVAVVVRDNDLDTHVLGRETSVKENLERITERLHQMHKKITLEYTFRFVDEFFDTFVASVYEEWQSVNFDGIKLDIEDCSLEDVLKIYDGIKKIRENLPDIQITVQLSDKIWHTKPSTRDTVKEQFEALGVTRTVSSKEELIYNTHELSDENMTYEISMYKNQDQYNKRLMLVDDAEKVDAAIDRRLETILDRVVKKENVAKLVLPVNMLYAQRLKDKTNENANVIQAVFNLARMFKEVKGMQERKSFAYKFGLMQKVVLTPDQEIKIERILRGDTTRTAASYVKEHFPYVFDYFVESRPTRIEVSSSFLMGIYEANVIRKYKEGEFGKVLQFTKSEYNDTPEIIEQRQQLFYKAVTLMCLYGDKSSVSDIELSENDRKFYTGTAAEIDSDIKDFYEYMTGGNWISSKTNAFKTGFNALKPYIAGYSLNGETALYEARLLASAMIKGYETEEIEPVLPVITENTVRSEDTEEQNNLVPGITHLLASA